MTVKFVGSVVSITPITIAKENLAVLIVEYHESSSRRFDWVRSFTLP